MREKREIKRESKAVWVEMREEREISGRIEGGMSRDQREERD